jgi:hypothetical protein
MVRVFTREVPSRPNIYLKNLGASEKWYRIVNVAKDLQIPLSYSLVGKHLQFPFEK